ncbi:MAG TPA: VWA domain-containing protein, partial [Phnomibacter sp.]|nr:VWA domain-containing protein [Phnomibacter sp.]
MELGYQHTEYAWLLLLLLPIVTFWYWWQWRKKKIIGGLASSPRFLNTLLHHYKPGRAYLRLILFVLAFAALVFSLTNPRVLQQRADVPAEGVQVMLVVDVSQSMLATDVAPNRLERARSFCMRLAESYAGSRMGLLAFAGEARLLMPPTTDLSAIRLALQTLSVSSVPLQGTNMEAALQEAGRTLSTDLKSKKAIVLISDGEALEGNGVASANELAANGIVLHTIGIGTTIGAPIRDAETGIYLQDEEGMRVISRIGEAELQQLAVAGKGKYQHLGEIDPTVEKVRATLADHDKAGSADTKLENYYSYASWVLILVFLLLLIDLLPLPLVFLKKAGASVLYCLLLTSSVHIAHGQSLSSQYQSGLHAYRNGQWQDAYEIFSRSVEEDPTKHSSLFYRGLSLYQ